MDSQASAPCTHPHPSEQGTPAATAQGRHSHNLGEGPSALREGAWQPRGGLPETQGLHLWVSELRKFTRWLAHSTGPAYVAKAVRNTAGTSM